MASLGIPACRPLISFPRFCINGGILGYISVQAESASSKAPEPAIHVVKQTHTNKYKKITANRHGVGVSRKLASIHEAQSTIASNSIQRYTLPL